MSVFELSKRDTIALSFAQALISQDKQTQDGQADLQRQKQAIVDAFELADEFIWVSSLSAEQPNSMVSTGANPTPTTPTNSQNAPTPQTSNTTTPSFQIFTPDHPRNR